VQRCARSSPTELAFGDTAHCRGPRQLRCDGVVTYHACRQGKNYLPGVGVPEGKSGDRAPGHGGRASFTLYVLLGPSLAVGLVLAGFSLTRDAGILRVTGDSSPTPAASPLVTPTNGSTPPLASRKGHRCSALRCGGGDPSLRTSFTEPRRSVRRRARSLLWWLRAAGQPEMAEGAHRVRP